MNAQVKIVDLKQDAEQMIYQAAQLLVDEFRENWPTAFPTLDEALESVRECLNPEFICRAALISTGEVVGWIGGRPEYDGNVWELHPLVVRQDWQRRQIGRTLVVDLEQLVAAKGGITLMLGTDDENNLTTLANADLYTDLPAQIAAIQNLGGHPYEFYQRLGFVIVGVVPDANGIGKPDIIMAKRVGHRD